MASFPSLFARFALQHCQALLSLPVPLPMVLSFDVKPLFTVIQPINDAGDAWLGRCSIALSRVAGRVCRTCVYRNETTPPLSSRHYF